MYPKWRSTHLDFGQGCSGSVETGFPSEHVWSQDAHVFGALPPATCVAARAYRRHPPRAAAARMPRYEAPPTTQKGGRGRGRAAGLRAFNWARHPNVTSRATPARGNGGTRWRRAND